MKRSLVVVLTIAMLLFAFVGTAVASEQDDAAARLQGFGIVEGYPDGSMGLDRDITRAEFAKIAVMAKGLGEAADLLVNSPSEYSDVQTGVWYTGWINVATAQGIVKGDPVGTFRPNDNISTAEAVTMILRVLGYNDNLVGSWPMNYLVKGADLGITTGLVSDASVKASRGVVFTMLNRALDEDVVAWERADKAEDADFTPKGYTLLQEMLNAKEEAKGWVIDNCRTDDSLDANEIRIRVEVDRDETKDVVFELLSNDDVDWLLGLKVEVKHNKDDEIAYVEVKTSDSDIIFDQVSAVAGLEKGDIKLRVQDKEYRYAADELVFVNFEEADLEVGHYGKFVLESGRIKNVVAFEPDDVGVVSEIDGDVYEFVFGVDGTLEDGELDFNDYDDVVLLNTKLTVFDGEIEVHDVIYAFEADVDGDDVLYVIVSDAKVEGTLERLRDDNARVTVDGKTYRNAPDAVYTIDEGDNYEAWGATVEDLLGEDVVLSTDFIGYVMLAAGDTKATSGTLYGVVTWYEHGRNPVVTIFTSEGEEVEYGFEDRSDATDWSKNNFEREKDTILVEYKLNKDGDIAEDEFSFVGYADRVQLSKNADSRYVLVGDDEATRYYISSSTKFFKAVDSSGDLDPSVLKYDDIYSTGFSDEDAIIIFNDNRDVKAIVFVHRDFVGTGDDDLFGVVTEKPWQDKDDYYVKINVFGEGVKEYKLDSRTNFAEGNIVKFNITSSGKAKTVTGQVYGLADFASKAKKITYRDGNFIGFGTLDDKGIPEEIVKVATGAVLYEVKANKRGGYDLEDPIRLSKIEVGKSRILYLENSDGEIVAAIVGRDADPGDSTNVPGGTITYINADTTNPVKDGKLTVKSSADLKFDVKFENKADKSVVVEANKATLTIKDAKGNQIDAKVNAASVVAGPKAKVDLFKDVEVKKDVLVNHVGTTLTVTVEVADEKAELKVYVQHNEAKAKSVRYGNVTAEFNTNNKATLVFPADFKLDEIDVDEFVVEVTNNGTYEVEKSQQDNEYTVTVTAEDGTAGTNATITVKNYEKATGDATATIPATIADVVVNYTANDSGEVKEVKIEGEKLVAGQFVDDGSKIILKEAYLTALVEDLADGDELEMTIKFADGTVLEVTLTVNKQ